LANRSGVTFVVMSESDLLAKWQSYLDSLPWQNGELHRTTFLSFVRARTLGVKRSWALDSVLSRLTRLGFKFRAATIADQCQCAYREEVHVGMPPVRSAPKPQRDPVSLQILVQRGDSWRLHDLYDHSPVRYDDQVATEDAIDLLFGTSDPLLCVGRSAFDFWTLHREELRGTLSALQFIVPCVMTSHFGLTMNGKNSAHSLANTGERNYLVIECDYNADEVRQLANWGVSAIDAGAAVLGWLLHYLPLAVATWSGGKSIHGWFAVRGVSDEFLARFWRVAFALGADQAPWKNKSQLVRMPDGLRDNGARQAILWMDPTACSTT
jgi:hypothetical protein